eukprot:m.46488 g.46488  ORF g.46488 m.46488 type:complete len:382 (-) comp7270_c0_seq1:210-1355(-)
MLWKHLEEAIKCNEKFLRSATEKVAANSDKEKEEALLLVAFLCLKSWNNSVEGAREFVQLCYNEYCVKEVVPILSLPNIAIASPFHVPRKPTTQSLTTSNVARFSSSRDQISEISFMNNENRDLVLTTLLRLVWPSLSVSSQAVRSHFLKSNDVASLKTSFEMSASLQACLVRTSFICATAENGDLVHVAKQQFEDLIVSSYTSSHHATAVQQCILCLKKITNENDPVKRLVPVTVEKKNSHSLLPFASDVANITTSLEDKQRTQIKEIHQEATQSPPSSSLSSINQEVIVNRIHDKIDALEEKDTKEAQSTKAHHQGNEKSSPAPPSPSINENVTNSPPSSPRPPKEIVFSLNIQDGRNVNQEDDDDEDIEWGDAGETVV